MSLDMQDFVAGFFEEAAEQMAEIEAGLLALESSPNSVDLLHEIFRAAHTIKGNSAMLGLSGIADFMHKVEGLLDRMRGGLLSPSKSLVDLLLRSADRLNGLLETAHQGDLEGAVETGSLAQELTAALAGEAAPDKASPAQVNDAEAIPSFQIHFRPGRESLQRGLDPLVILENLAACGELLRVEAKFDELPALSLIDPFRCYGEWDLQLQTVLDAAVIHDVFEFVDDESTFRIAPVENLAAKAEPKVNDAPAPGSPAPTGDTTAATSRGAKSEAASESIRVSVHKVEQLINTVGELVIANSMLRQALQDLPVENLLTMHEAMAGMDSATRDLQEQVMAVRLMPVNAVFQRLPRLVRDLANTLQKSIKLEISGEDTELDKQVIEEIGDPLVHLIRNAVDHGIELPQERLAAGKPAEGTIKVSAFHEGGAVVIQIVDDGKGLNTERIRAKAVSQGLIDPASTLTDHQIHALIFRPGFSTAEQVTEVSGRGVGMDVVRRNIEQLKGSIDVVSRPGQGCTLTIKLPLTMAILDGLTIRVGEEMFVLPLLSVVESMRPKPSEIKTMVGKGEMVSARGEVLPLYRLHQLFNIPADHDNPCDGLVVILEHQMKKIGLLVDALDQQQQVVMKSLEANYAKVHGIAGATILGDGKVALIVDVAALTEMA